MIQSRRPVIALLGGALGLLVAEPVLSGRGQHVQPVPSPNAPNPNLPLGVDGGRGIRQADGTTPNPVQNPALIVASVHQLFTLASDLRDEADKTNLATVFPVDFVKKAQQIEKLAKQIKDRAKG